MLLYVGAIFEGAAYIWIIVPTTPTLPITVKILPLFMVVTYGALGRRRNRPNERAANIFYINTIAMATNKCFFANKYMYIEETYIEELSGKRLNKHIYIITKEQATTYSHTLTYFGIIIFILLLLNFSCCH